MPTDVSTFKNVYKTAITAGFPKEAALVIGSREYPMKMVPYGLRYGTNPHQPFAAYAPAGMPMVLGDLEILKGGKAGLSLTNVQDMSQALNILKYFDRPSCAVMKHINPCGFKVGSGADALKDIYVAARECDSRSAFGSVVGFNRPVDADTAEEIMTTFVEGVLAPEVTPEALDILKRNEGTKKRNNSIRVAKYKNLDRIPKYVGDNAEGYYNLRNLIDGTLCLEVPYLTRVRSVGDLITDAMIPNSDPEVNCGRDIVAKKQPSAREMDDCLTAWYVNINVRSNGIVFVKNGQAIAVGTGEQERVGAIEQAIDKAVKKGHDLKGAVVSSDGLFPMRDSIDTLAGTGVSAVVWPAGSLKDADVIMAANEHDMALLATLERCFLHI